ncbi:MAG: RHS repeat protein [Verrucomicrobiae bacterium]|nr:RHS repeat protein [Verrucomicrobiae bacterium]
MLATTRAKIMALAGGFLVAAAIASFGCGVDWTLPKDHFDGVNERGFVSWWGQLGTLDLGDGVQLPLVAGFQSDRDWSSPVLGKGWILALLDSSLMAIDEKTFILVKPDGWSHDFYRDRKNPSVLDGGSWKGETKDNTATLWASCGWKLVYEKGKLASITTPKNRTLQWMRGGDGSVREIREGGQTHLAVEVNPSKGVDRALVFNGQRVDITWGDRLRVGADGMDRAVVRIALGGASTSGASVPSLPAIASVTAGRSSPAPLSFSYGFDAKRHPTLTVSREGESPRVLAWDRFTRLIVSDGEWTYDIKPGNKPVVNAAIGRKNAQRQTEFWHEESEKGREVVIDQNGVTRTTTRFVHGPLSGKLRKIEEASNGITRVVQQISYDEKGRVLRSIDAQGSVEIFTYDQSGRRVSSRDPTSQQLATEETQLKEEIAHATDLNSKSAALYTLGLFYADKMSSSQKARDTAAMIANASMRFTVVLHSYDHDNTLSSSEKVRHYKQLIKEYPEETQRLNSLITLRTMEDM